MQTAHTFGEANGLTHLTRPIGRIDCFLARDRAFRSGWKSRAAAVASGAAARTRSWNGSTIASIAWRMERVRGLKPTAGDRLRGELALEPVDSIMLAGNNHKPRRVVGCDTDTIAQKPCKPRQLAPSQPAWRPKAEPASRLRVWRQGSRQHRDRRCRRALRPHTRRGCVRSSPPAGRPTTSTSRARAYSMTNRAGWVKQVCFSSSAAAADASGAG